MHPELLAAIEADPTNRDALAVYADALLEQNHGFGHLIQSALAGTFDADKAHLHALTRIRASRFASVNIAAWDPATGFLRAVDAYGHNFKALLLRLSRLPEARLLRRLRLQVFDHDRTRAKNAVPAFRRAPLPPSVRELMIDVGGDLRGLSPHVQQIEDLELRAPRPLGPLVAPKLKVLRINDYDEATLRDLAASTFPALKELELNATNLPHLERLDVPLERLECLTLGGGTVGVWSESFAQLARSPLRDRIRVLDVAGCCGVAGSTRLAEVAPAFTRLEEVYTSEYSDAFAAAFGSRIRASKPIRICSWCEHVTPFAVSTGSCAGCGRSLSFARFRQR